MMRIACRLIPVMRQVVGGRAVDAKAASSSQMGRFETEVLIIALRWLTCQGNGSTGFTNANLPGSRWIWISPDPRSAGRHGLERSFRLHVLSPAVGLVILNAALCGCGWLERRSEVGHGAICRSAPSPSQTSTGCSKPIAHLLKRPVGRACATYVIAKVEWHPGELFPRVGFVVTNMPMEADWIIQFYNQRGTASTSKREKAGNRGRASHARGRGPALHWQSKALICPGDSRLVADQPPNTTDQNRREGRPPRPPKRKFDQPRPCRHPKAGHRFQHAEKRLGWFVPTAVDQAESCETSRQSETERLDHGPNWLKHTEDGGECGILFATVESRYLKSKRFLVNRQFGFAENAAHLANFCAA